MGIRAKIIFGLAAAITIAGAGVLAKAAPEQQPTADTHVTVRAEQTLNRLGHGATGVSDPSWTPLLKGKASMDRLRAAGTRSMVYDSGPASDLYDWRTNSLRSDPDKDKHAVDLSTLAPALSFDDFARLARKQGAEATVHVNYGTGTPREAADWVRYANRDKGYRVRDWEIGEESYLNGWSGFWFEPDAHKNPDGTPEGPQAWARNALPFVAAMKAADPTIRVGIPVADPNQPHHADDAVKWNTAVLGILGPVIDFVDVHWYPQGATANDAALLAAPRTTVPGSYGKLRDEITSGGGHARIVVGETNSIGADYGKQTVGLVNALFLVDDELSWLEQGAQGVDWFGVHVGPQVGVNNGPDLYGDANFGDLGVLSAGVCKDTDDHQRVCEPPVDTPFAPYYTMKLLGEVATPGSQPIAARSDNGAVVVHALRGPDGTITVLLENTDRDTTHRAGIDLPGVPLEHGATLREFGKGSTDVTTRWEPGPVTAGRDLPPYSITAITMQAWR